MLTPMLIGSEGTAAAFRGGADDAAGDAPRAASIRCGSFGRRLACTSTSRAAPDCGASTDDPTGGDTSDWTASLTSGFVSTCCADAETADARAMQRTVIPIRVIVMVSLAHWPTALRSTA